MQTCDILTTHKSLSLQWNFPPVPHNHCVHFRIRSGGNLIQGSIYTSARKHYRCGASDVIARRSGLTHRLDCEAQRHNIISSILSVPPQPCVLLSVIFTMRSTRSGGIRAFGKCVMSGRMSGGESGSVFAVGPLKDVLVFTLSSARCDKLKLGASNLHVNSIPASVS